MAGLAVALSNSAQSITDQFLCAIPATSNDVKETKQLFRRSLCDLTLALTTSRHGDDAESQHERFWILTVYWGIHHLYRWSPEALADRYGSASDSTIVKRSRKITCLVHIYKSWGREWRQKLSALVPLPEEPAYNFLEKLRQISNFRPYSAVCGDLAAGYTRRCQSAKHCREHVLTFTDLDEYFQAVVQPITAAPSATATKRTAGRPPTRFANKRTRTTQLSDIDTENPRHAPAEHLSELDWDADLGIDADITVTLDQYSGSPKSSHLSLPGFDEGILSTNEVDPSLSEDSFFIDGTLLSIEEADPALNEDGSSNVSQSQRPFASIAPSNTSMRSRSSSFDDDEKHDQLVQVVREKSRILLSKGPHPALDWLRNQCIAIDELKVKGKAAAVHLSKAKELRRGIESSIEEARHHKKTLAETIVHVSLTINSLHATWQTNLKLVEELEENRRAAAQLGMEAACAGPTTSASVDLYKKRVADEVALLTKLQDLETHFKQAGQDEEERSGLLKKLRDEWTEAVKELEDLGALFGIAPQMGYKEMAGVISKQ
jgi:hypothetical protein